MNDLDRNNFQIQGWTEPRVAQLKALWGTLSASQIARELGHGVSRNAVIGKSHRLGLTTPRKPVPPSKEVVMAKKSRGGRMTAAKTRAAKSPGGKGPIKKRPAGKKIMST